MTTQDIDLGVVARGDKGDKGDKGDVGPTGPAPTLTVGSVTKLSPSQSPTVSLSGSNGTYSMSFGIPQGATGDTNATATQALDTANSAKSKVTAIQANGGGVNLAHNTSNAYVIPGDPVGYKNIGSLSTDEWVALAGETITIGVTIEWTNWQVSGNNRIGFELAPAKNGKGYWNNAFSLWYHPVNGSSGKQRLTATRTINNDIDGVNEGFAYVQGKCDTAKISELMIERGSVAHDWSPAPEDTQSEIDANKTATANAQNTANKALSKANSNAAVLNNKANKSDLTWANISGKPSIPNADDTTTVSSGDLNNYTTTGKYYMPNSLSKYTNHPTTGTDMGDWFIMKVDVYQGFPIVLQTIYQLNSGDVWTRFKQGNTWKSWRQINFWS